MAGIPVNPKGFSTLRAFLKEPDLNGHHLCVKVTFVWILWRMRAQALSPRDQQTYSSKLSMHCPPQTGETNSVLNFNSTILMRVRQFEHRCCANESAHAGLLEMGKAIHQSHPFGREAQSLHSPTQSLRFCFCHLLLRIWRRTSLLCSIWSAPAHCCILQSCAASPLW